MGTVKWKPIISEWEQSADLVISGGTKYEVTTSFGRELNAKTEFHCLVYHYRDYANDADFVLTGSLTETPTTFMEGKSIIYLINQFFAKFLKFRK